MKYFFLSLIIIEAIIFIVKHHLKLKDLKSKYLNQTLKINKNKLTTIFFLKFGFKQF